jgi:hypothetical protein
VTNEIRQTKKAEHEEILEEDSQDGPLKIVFSQNIEKAGLDLDETIKVTQEKVCRRKCGR